MKFDIIGEIIEEICQDYLDGIADNCDQEGNVDFGGGVNYKTKEELLEDFITFIKFEKTQD